MSQHNRNTQAKRALAASLELNIAIERTAMGVLASLGVKINSVNVRCLEEDQRMKSPRFASSIRLTGIETALVNGVRVATPCTHIEPLQKYASLDFAQRKTEDLFQRFGGQSSEQYEALLQAGERPFLPDYATVVDQFGYAIARSEVHVDSSTGDRVPCWFKEAVFGPRQHTVQQLRASLSEVRKVLKSIVDGAAPENQASEDIRKLRREVQSLSDRANIIELAPLVC